jgi:hypothetical protein
VERDAMQRFLQQVAEAQDIRHEKMRQEPILLAAKKQESASRIHKHYLDVAHEMLEKKAHALKRMDEIGLSKAPDRKKPISTVTAPLEAAAMTALGSGSTETIAEYWLRRTGHEPFKQLFERAFEETSKEFARDIRAYDFTEDELRVALGFETVEDQQARKAQREKAGEELNRGLTGVRETFLGGKQ